MLRSTLNLGILAHVDAGKTTLSERLLYEAGVIGEIGRVDDGTTQTDSLELERRRGITIRAAVVSLEIGGTAVNLIDTPGHPDFIAEVDRVLGVLDGAVLVVSAVEGVQPQTRVLMRALRRLGVPTIIFINKIDRMGADAGRVLAQLRERLGLVAVPVWQEREILEQLTLGSDDLLAEYVVDGVGRERLWAELAAQTRQSRVCPVYIGSALAGEGVKELMAGVVELLPAVTGDTGGPVRGGIFKIERGTAGEKVSYVRLFSGTVHIRDKFGDDKVSGISVFDKGAWKRSDSATAGQIAKLWGLAHAKVGQAIGMSFTQNENFALPALESRVSPVRAEDHVALRAALAQLSEQDPLINVRDLNVSLYGEVQKEVIEATLAADYGIDVVFEETAVLHIERPLGVGEAVEVLNAPENPFRATIGLRVEPAPHGSGVEFRLEVGHHAIPQFVYGNAENFAHSMRGYILDTLREGLHGWVVSDCVVTMFASNYSTADGPPSQRGPTSTAADFRKLTPMAMMRALQAAGTAVCRPFSRVRLDIPTESLGAILSTLSTLEAVVERQEPRGDDFVLEAVTPSGAVHVLQTRLPGLTGGEGVLEATPAGRRPVSADPPPRRRRSTVNPLHRTEYLTSLSTFGGSRESS